jgi:hypothetical protein
MGDKEFRVGRFTLQPFHRLLEAAMIGGDVLKELKEFQLPPF